MAVKAMVPIVVAYLDFEKKEVGIKGVIYELEDYTKVIRQINLMYKDVTGKEHQNFSLSSVN